MQTLPLEPLVWTGITLCISQSAIFSGLNLALMGISRLRLEVEAHGGNPDARRILRLREDVNFLLSTILWGNVGINVLLTLLSNSVMTGAVAFLFSTFLITFAGEIVPQAYFSRHAMRLGARLAPLIRIYQLLLYPVAKPTALFLDHWLGREGISYFREKDLLSLIHKHIDSEQSDVGHMEGIGAINFLRFDDIPVEQEGEPLDPASIIQLPTRAGMPVFPHFERALDDPLLRRINSSGKKWIVLVDEQDNPRMVLNANAFLRAALFGAAPLNPYAYCHKPIVVSDDQTQLGNVVTDLNVHADSEADDVVDNDLVLVWGNARRIITGSDILGRLLRGITRREGRVSA